MFAVQRRLSGAETDFPFRWKFDETCVGSFIHENRWKNFSNKISTKYESLRFSSPNPNNPSKCSRKMTVAEILIDFHKTP